ncbi:MAG: helix-turn-helix domain-containing protein [Cytophagales bacterium]|nr:helix-turn-helix domain-containing protein [Cytophagales bacterium]
MENTQMLITLATLSPVFINITGGVYLLFMSGKAYPNRRLLAFFMMNSALLFAGHFLFFHGYVNRYRHYDFTFLFALLSFFPLYYFYVKRVFYTGSNDRFSFLHFVPAIIISTAAFTLATVIGLPGFKTYFFKMAGMAELSTDLQRVLYRVYQLARSIHIVQVILYSLAIVFHITVNIRRLKDYFSNANDLNTKSFVLINGLFLIFMIVSGLFTTIAGRGFFYDSVVVLGVSGLVFSLAHLMVCLHGIKQSPIDIQMPANEAGDTALNNNRQQIEQQLLLYFEEQKPWLKPGLTIWDVAMHLGTNKTYLSEVINKRLNFNFNDFVNHYRYLESERIMKHDAAQSLSLQAIAWQAGFGSEASFARTVRKHSGLSPSGLRKKLIG